MRQRGLLYSTACTYGLQAAVYLARHPEGATAPEIAADCGLLPYALANVLRTLTARGILCSTRGVRGGFRLNRDPLRIRLADLVFAIDGRRFPAMPRPPVPGAQSWHELRAAIRAFLNETTIAHLARAADALQEIRAAAAAE